MASSSIVPSSSNFPGHLWPSYESYASFGHPYRASPGGENENAKPAGDSLDSLDSQAIAEAQDEWMAMAR